MPVETLALSGSCDTSGSLQPCVTNCLIHLILAASTGPQFSPTGCAQKSEAALQKQIVDDCISSHLTVSGGLRVAAACLTSSSL
jgi:hypothetical protein